MFDVLYFVCVLYEQVKWITVCPLVRYEQIIVSFVCLLVCLSVCLSKDVLE